MRAAIIALLIVLVAAPSMAAVKFWVTADQLNKRTCPSAHCGILGHLRHREDVVVYECKDGWARISKHYDASCSGGKSALVKAGDAVCSSSNGIADGSVAEWVSMEYLSAAAPRDSSVDDGGTGTTRLWVTADRLNRRTCPSIQCGIVGQLFRRDGVTVYEEKDRWARVSKRQNASCLGGKSRHVERGDAMCTASNGIADGAFAEWVSMEYLTGARPPDLVADKGGIANTISESADFEEHRSAFLNATNRLVASRKCTLRDFREVGGWAKPTTTFRDRPVYFTYCGGRSPANRIYLDVHTGAIFQ